MNKPKLKGMKKIMIVCASILSGCSLFEEEPCTLYTGEMYIDTSVVYPYLSPAYVGVSGSFQYGDCGAFNTTISVPEGTLDNGAKEDGGGIGYSFFGSGDIEVTVSAQDQSETFSYPDYKYVDTEIWGKLPHQRDFNSNPVALNLQGRLFAGMNRANDWYEINPTTYVWEERAANGLLDFVSMGGFERDGLAYVVGLNGYIYKYDPSSDTWENTIEMIDPDTGEHVSVAAAFDFNPVDIWAFSSYTFINGDKFYFGGGYSQKLISYDFNTQTWEWENSPMSLFPASRTISQQFVLGDKYFIDGVYFNFPTETWVLHDFAFNDTKALAISEEKAYYFIDHKVVVLDPTVLTEVAYENEPNFEVPTYVEFDTQVTWQGISCMVGKFNRFYKQQ